MKEVIKKLKRLGAERVLIQYPEGLKLRIQDIAKEIEMAGIEPVISLEETFGACDVRDEEALRLGCDAILHIGHEKFVKKAKLPVVYWEYFLEADPLPILEKDFYKLNGYESIGLITSIQFVKLVPIVKKYLHEKGKKVFVHKAFQYPGQVLGCRLDAAKKIEKMVDCFLCISAGEFYASGIVLITQKPVLNLDLEKREIENLENFRKKVLKIKAWNKAQFKESKKVGVLVSWKKGQVMLPYQLKERLEKLGKEVYLLAMDEITPEKLEGLQLDFLINLACPRIGIDDLERFKIPLFNVEDII